MVDASLRATILGSIDLLNKELGIAVIYITHDLTTAFQISDNIIVMYQGSVVESGRVEDVIRTRSTPTPNCLSSLSRAQTRANDGAATWLRRKLVET